MLKAEFLNLLRKKLSQLPKDDIEERIDFYSEMIDDYIEEGLSEEEAIKKIGDAESVASQIISETPLLKIVKERIKPKRRLGALEITLLALGSPIWLSLIISAFAVAFSLLISVWAVAISLWAGFISVAASSGAGILGSAVLLISGRFPLGIALLSAGIICFGIAIFFFFGCKETTRGIIWLTKRGLLAIKICFTKGGMRNE